MNNQSLPLRSGAPQGAIWLAAMLFSLLALSFSSAAPPPNDSFSGRLTLTEGVTVSADTTEATIEPGEPVEEADRTIWYTWTASSDAIVSLDNIGTDIRENFFAIFMGGSIDKLAFVAGRFFSLGSGTDRISIPVKAGTTFQIVAGSTRNRAGRSQLTLTTNPFPHVGTLFGPPPPVSKVPVNDDFSNRSVISGSALTALSYNGDATLQGGEPNRPFDNFSKSVWFSWTAPANATVSIDTTGTDFRGHFFAVYVGHSIQTLSTVAGNSTSGSEALTDSFPATAGSTYTILAGSTRADAGTIVFTLTTTPPPTGSLLNLSTRGLIGTGDSVLIAGFIVRGGAKRLVVRGIGPSLAAARVANALLDPSIELRDASGGLLARNNNWQEDAQQAAAIQSSGLAPTDPRESALAATVQPGNYTVITQGVNGAGGVGLVEVYDIEGTAATSKAVNVSTRGFVSTGDAVMIGGFIVGGGSPAHVIIRGIGPSLAAFGISNALQNPILDLFDANGSRLHANDNWRDVPNFGQVVDAGLAPSDARESALSVTLNPSNYTVILSGLNGTTGVGLVEVFRGP